MDIRGFLDKRAEMDRCYTGLGEIADSLGAAELAGQLSQARQILVQDTFNMVVVGEFSRGKSTFINALLGSRVLPMATRPTTTMINRIAYGDEKRITLHFRDSEEKQILTEEEFKEITAVDDVEEASEQELSQYQERIAEIGRIAYAQLEYPLELCQGGIELIDTPGTNDLDQVREEIIGECQ